MMRSSLFVWASGRVVAVLALLTLLTPCPAAADMTGTKHDLSTTFEPYSNQICAFCHTPHFANTNVAGPLWNRFVDQSQAFTTYQSSTMDTVTEQPTFTVSEVCLGCHDGTLGTAVVRGITGSTKHDLVNAPGPGGIPDTTSYPDCSKCHPGIYGYPPALWQGTDLSDDHPISMVYPTPAQDAEFNLPPDLVDGWSDIPLFDGRVQCPTCHDVHDGTYVPFLRKPNLDSQLCLTCHLK